MRDALKRLGRLEAARTDGLTDAERASELIQRRCEELLGGRSSEPDPFDPATEMLMESIFTGMGLRK